MSASRDEASFGFSIDAPFDVGTPFYALVGDNFYTYASTSSDIDSYYLITNIGTSYSIVSVDNSTVGNTYIGLYDLNGNFITGSVDSGAFSGITFTATSTKYFIGLSAQFPGIYGARVANNTITEVNGIGESISFNRTYSGALDYVSDSDRFSFSVVSGKQYTLTYSTNVSDLYFKLTYLYNFSSTLIAILFNSESLAKILRFSCFANSIYFLIVSLDRSNDLAICLWLLPLMCWYSTSLIVDILYFLIQFNLNSNLINNKLLN